jgi:general stress protein 26
VQVRDSKQLVSLGNAADPRKLLNEMNAIWNPQANVYFELGRTDPATIDGLSLQADAIEMQK